MFSLDLTSGVPLYEQICNKTIELIAKGTLKENDRMPSVRTFAKDAGITPNTVAKAYQELENKKILYSIPGKGSFVSKMDDSFYKDFVFADFDNIVKSIIRNGIGKDVLKERIESIAKNQEGNNHD